MGLNLNSGSESFVPYLKYNSKDGRWYVRSEDGKEVELQQPRIAFDFAFIRTGWFIFEEGQAPTKVYDFSLSEMRPKPSNSKAKRGFECLVYCGDKMPDGSVAGVRELSAVSSALSVPINVMYEAFEVRGPDHEASIPVYKCVGTNRVGKHGNHEPIFELEKWVERGKLQVLMDAQADREAGDMPVSQQDQPSDSAYEDDPIPF